MRAVVFASVALTLVACSLGAATPYAEPLTNYHDAVGFKLAAQIKADEEAFFRNIARGEERIVGGSIAPANAYPYLGGLVITFWNVAGQSVCGSSLISSNRLITAAHCWSDSVNQARQFEVVLGSQFLFFGGTRIPTSAVFVHPSWTPATLLNDVAIIYLPVSVSFNNAIQPVALPSAAELQDSFAGSWAQAAGFGRTSDTQGVTVNTQISHVNLNVITVAECQAWFGHFAQASNICTSGVGFVGICSGDSGGPLVVNRNGRNILVGVSSFVNSNGCQLGSPSGFARVTSFNSFILQHL